MKRRAELVPLSHDHHQALFVAMQLERTEDPEVSGAAFLDFFTVTGRLHFRVEEEILLPGWLEGDPAAEREMAARVLTEHLTIRELARRLDREGLPLEDLRELGRLLKQHVRFEERELFPRIEAGLEAGAIARLGAEITAAEAGEDAG